MSGTAGEGRTRSRPPGSGRAWLVYLLLGVVVLLGYFLLPLPEEIRAGTFVALGVVNTTVIFAGVRMHRPKHSLVWLMLAGSFLAAAAGNATGGIYVLASGNVPLPSLADIFYLGGYALLIGAALIFVRVRNPNADRASLVDAAIVATGAFMLMWAFLISPYVQDSDFSLVERFFLAAYPLLDILLLAVVIRLLIVPGSRPVAYWMLVLGVSAMLSSDVLFSTSVLAGFYELGNLLESGWLVAHFFAGAAALHPSMREVAEPALGRPVEHSRKRLAMLGGALLFGPAILAIQAATGDRIDATLIVGGSVVLLLLTLVRTEGVLRTLSTALEELRDSEEELRNSEQRLRTVVGSVPVVLFALDKEGIFTLSEGRGLKALGLEQGEVVGRSVFEVYGEMPVIVENIRRALAGETVSLVAEIDGVSFEAWYAPLWGPEGNVRGVIGVGADVTERVALEEQLRYQALHDPLTNLPNRTLLAERFRRAQDRAERHGVKVAVLFLDLDNFKVINDSLGHEVGDRLLAMVSERLSTRCVGPGDTTARLGGDEFVILLTGVTGLREAQQAAERVAEVLQEPFHIEGVEREVFVTTSVGITLGQSREEPKELLRRADLAMYKAKYTGKSRHETYDPALNARVHERLLLESDLRRAAEREEMRLYYQPKVHLETGALVGVEALLRWEHPERGLLPPSEFVPLAEETGLIVPLERWALREACEQIREWRALLKNSSPPTVSLNISARQFRHPRFIKEVEKALKEAGLEPKVLALELTETAAMEDHEQTIHTLKRLNNLGVGLAIDDFGTGYSSLVYLKRFPVDEIKIDRSITEGMEKDPGDRAIVEATVMLAQALNLEVVAEGVETESQARELLSLGCDVGQGHYWQKPSPPENIDEFLKNLLRT